MNQGTIAVIFLLLLISPTNGATSVGGIGYFYALSSFDLSLNPISEYTSDSLFDFQNPPIYSKDGVFIFNKQTQNLDQLDVTDSGTLFLNQTEVLPPFVSSGTFQEFVESKNDTVIGLYDDNILIVHTSQLEFSELFVYLWHQGGVGGFGIDLPNVENVEWPSTVLLYSTLIDENMLYSVFENESNSTDEIYHTILEYDIENESYSLKSYNSSQIINVGSKVMTQLGEDMVFLHSGKEGNLLERINFESTTSVTYYTSISQNSILLGSPDGRNLFIQDFENRNYETETTAPQLSQSNPMYQIVKIDLESMDHFDIGFLPNMENGYLLGDYFVHMRYEEQFETYSYDIASTNDPLILDTRMILAIGGITLSTVSVIKKKKGSE